MTTAKTEVVILCGGLGSRISKLLPLGTPKVLADVGGVVFLDLLLDKLAREKFTDVTLSTGYGHDKVVDHINARSRLATQGLNIKIRRDLELRGTLRAAFSVAAMLAIASNRKVDDVVFINGDTHTFVSLSGMIERHRAVRKPLSAVIGPNAEPNGIVIASLRPFVELCLRRDDKKKLVVNIDKDFLRKNADDIRFFNTDSQFYDIGTPQGLETFKALRDWGEYLRSSQKLRTEFPLSAAGPTTQSGS
jgi:NDP-sugar pyrophosphorylase family protein